MPVELRKVEKKDDGSVWISGRGSSSDKTVTGTIISVETPEFVKHLEKLAQKNMTTVEIERQKTLDSAFEW